MTVHRPRCIVVVPADSGIRNNELHYMAPYGMHPQAAADIATEAVRQVKRAFPDDYQSYQITKALEKLGFSQVQIVTANEVW